MAKNSPEIPAAGGTASSRRRSPRFNSEEINVKKKKREENRREKKTAKKENPIGVPCKKKVSMKNLLARQPRTKRMEPSEPVDDIGPVKKRKRAISNNEDDDHKKTTTEKKKNSVNSVNSVNPVGRPRKNKDGDDQVKTTAKKKNPVGRPCKKNKEGYDQTTAKKKNPVGRPCKKNNGSKANAADIKAEMEQGEEERVVTRVMEIGQVWAFPNAAASGGGFPRNYARIDRIIPIPPLLEVTPLIPQSILDEEKKFAELRIAYACGVFKASESTAIKDMALFTHEAKFEVGGEGRDLYKIFPRKGEIWAVYWNSNSEYKLVEALSDFSEKDGVNVYALTKIEGMDGVYQRQLPEGFYMIRCFSRGFMPMFSHRVPAKILEESAAMRWKVSFH